MTERQPVEVVLRDLTEADIPTLFEVQLDETAQHLAAFVGAAARDEDAYLATFRRAIADSEIVSKVAEVDGGIVGSCAAFPMDGDLEITYWIRRDLWGRGIATAAVAALLDEVTARPIYARVVEDNLGSVRVLEHNGFVRVGSERAFAEARQATVTELTFVRAD